MRAGMAQLDGRAQLDGKVAVITGATAGIGLAIASGGRRDEPDLTSSHPSSHPSRRACGIAVLTAGSREHYDYAVWPGRRSAQAAPSALTRPKGA